MASDTQNVYLQRINRAIDHVLEHVDQPLSVETLAEVACFSPHHFHRIFTAIVGETVGAFIKRVRLERAIYLMRHGMDRSLLDIALRCGFQSASDFSRSFKKRFGVAPREFLRSDDRSLPVGEERWARPTKLSDDMADDLYEVVVRDCPALDVAYYRVIDPTRDRRLGDGCDLLLDWAEQRGLAGCQLIGCSEEDPYITPPEHYRYDFCLTVPPDTRTEPPISRRTLPANLHACLRYRGGIDVVIEATDFLWEHWLPRSNYEPTNDPALEVYLEDPRPAEWRFYAIELRLPVFRIR